MLWFFLSGCAQMAANSRLGEIRKELDPKVGTATDEQMAHEWGPPDKRETIGASEYWTYAHSYGARSTTTAYATGNGTAMANGQTIDRFDRVVLEFKDGVLVDWRANVQR